MKKIICTLFFGLLISVSVVYAERNPIILMAEAPIGPIKAPIPISAGQSEGQIEITFMTDFGWIDVCVENSLEVVVYQEGVDTDVISYVEIDTTPWPAGDYVLTITLVNGIVLSGEFTL